MKGLNSCERDEKGIKMSALITCNHVDFGYENHDAVVDLTMEVDSGDYLCVVGENGSGKSTLMKGLLGLIKPTAGTLTVAEELKKKSTKQWQTIFEHENIWYAPAPSWASCSSSTTSEE